ncbi:phage tail tape measure protein [Coprococcus comes]|uniref:phage tail tape measure protein n=1 Tax=Coprococcus comes TaxID=410072 RepID=UPI00189AF71E|nr:phage tail tape measure protein [Coprococcus comes]
MADGYLNFDTKINENGFNKGISNLSKIATTGLGVAVGNAITKVVDKVGSIGTAAVKVGMNFEAEMSKVASISGATGDEFQKLIDKAKEMGSKTKFSATESAQAMEYMAMAGWKTQDMVDGLKGIMDLAAASGEDLATTSDIVTDALTAFGLKASDSTHFADVLAKASSNANTNVAMMGETFKYVAPVAGAMGYSVEDCSVAIGLMANSGIKASQAGTSLRQMLSRLAKPTDEVQSAMDQLGISLTDSAGNMMSLDTVMSDLRNGFKGLSKAEQAQLATSLAGQEAMSGLLAIVNASDGDFDKLKDSIYNCKDAAANMAAVAQDNLAGQITSLKSKAEGLGIAFYGSIQEPLKELASVGVKALEDLNNAYASNGFVGFINEIGNKVPLLQSFTDAIAGLAEKTKSMSTDELMNLGKTAAVLAGAGPVISLFGSQIGNVQSAVEGFSGITTGVLSELGKLPKGFKSATKSAANFRKDFTGSLKGFGSAVTGPFQVLTPKLSATVGKIGKVVSSVPGKIGGAVSKIGSAIASKIPRITSAFSLLGDTAGYLGAWGGQIGSALQGVLGTVAGFIPSFVGLMNFGAVAAVVVAGLGLVYSQFGTQIDQILLLAQTKGPEIISNFGAGITAALPGLISSGATLILGLMNAITANLPSLISVGASIIATLVSSLGAQLPQLIPAAVQMILTLVESLISNLPQLITSGLQLMEGLAQGIANAIPQVAAKAPVIIGKLASTIITNLPKIIQTGVKIITQLAVGLVQGIPALLGKIPSMISQIKNAFTSVNWGSVGMNIIRGIASGLTSAAKSLAEAAANAADNALNWVKSKLGIHSPSRVFRDQVGKMMALGMGIGFEKNIPVGSMNAGVQKAVQSLQRSVQLTTSVNPDKTVGGIKNNPIFKDQGFDYDRFERIQRKIAKENGNKPVFLDTKRIDRPLPKGAVPQV